MLTLEIQNQQLNTSADFSVQIEDQNPATKFDEIPGDLSLNIELPGNDLNRTILNNPDRFEKMGSSDDRRFTNACLRLNGQIIQKGTLIIEETTNAYSGWVRGAVGNLAEKTAGKYINQSMLSGEKMFVNKDSYDPGTDDYACPKIFNRHFWRDRGRKAKRTIVSTDIEGNEYNTEVEDGELTFQFFSNQDFFVNKPGESGLVGSGTNTAPVLSPMLFLYRVIELVLSDYYVFVKDNFVKNDAELKKLIIYNNFNIIKQNMLNVESKYVFVQDYWENRNVQLSVQSINIVYSFAGKFFYRDLLPQSKIGDFIRSCQNLLNVVFSFNDLNECRIVDRQQLLVAPAYDVDEYMVGEWKLGERKNVTVKLSMSHDEQDAAFGDNWQDLSDMRENIKEPVLQRVDLDILDPELDEIRKVLADDCYYQYHWYVATTINKKNEEEEVDVLGWERISIGFQPYFYNDGDKDLEEIKTDFSTLRQSENGYPVVMQKGNAESFKTQFASFSPRLLFYLGDEAGSYRTSTMSLDYDGEFGLAKKRWNYWLPFWANRLPAKAIFQFPASVFYYIRNNKAILPLRTRHGSFIIDKMRAIAGRQDMIECELEVFKRESIATYKEGSVPGSGGGSGDVFSPDYVAVTTNGKPYLVDKHGNVRVPPAWGPLSPTAFAKSVCVDYDPVNRILFVGGYAGTLYVTSLADIENMQMKSIKVFGTSNISCVRLCNGKILVGRDASNQVYVQPHFSDIHDYADGQAGVGILSSGYTAKDFLFHNGYYYSSSQAGEIHRTSNPSGNWAELTDRAADFRKMVATDNKLIVFGKDDNRRNDRNFFALKNTPTTWNEFDIESSSDVYVSDAVAYDLDRALVVTNKEYGGVKILNSNNSTVLFTPPLAKNCGGICVSGGSAVVAIQEGSGATKIAISDGGSWSYLNVPQFFTKLFGW